MSGQTTRTTTTRLGCKRDGDSPYLERTLRCSRNPTK
jgi:hypothetical protein